ncbi:type VI secretion system lipoprotein TssJ [Alkalilimnicola ehrlichii]|uniref:type VI secretion system lipoprotein TssJ n=1 Tax=Alkalilimnicola ehrlichii TaxID=351052 RepID=UPI0021621D61|nr:type VI secretion system lipoprotein TssJ [Alkalilimnicola ehrlichii]
MRVGVSSTANLNMNEFNEPLPVVVRVYQLSSAQAFENATFEDLWRDDIAALGDSLVMKEEVVIDPADQRRFEMDRHDQAEYVGAVAIFREPGEQGWKSIQPLPSNYVTRRLSRNIKVSLRGNTVAVED